MCEFYCTVGATEDISSRLSSIFNDAIHEGVTLTAGARNALLHSNPLQTPINDAVIKDDSDGSWLALLGIPLISCHKYRVENRIGFMRQFFKNPVEFLRTQVDGHFALIGYDATCRTCFLATDFNSFIPIFYSETSDGFIVSSSELSLSKALQCKIDPEGLWQAVTLGVTWSSRTRFEGINKLLPCELLTFNQHQLTKERYWKPEEEQQWQNINFEETVARWKKTLKFGVKSFVDHSTSDKLSSDLTGGEDSRLIVAQCRDLNLPFTTRVAGYPDSQDIEIAERCTKEVDLPLETHFNQGLDEILLSEKAMDICRATDGYGSFFSSCVRYSSNRKHQQLESQRIHLCGVPGGEAFRGSYYLRAKLLFPSQARVINERAFINLKFMLDYLPGLFGTKENIWKENIYLTAKRNLKNIRKFPAGTQVDHLMRMFQTCLLGLSIRHPFYMPLGLKDLTRSIYQIMPHHKQDGKLTRAVTEDLFPELARLKTQTGVPTIRWRLSRAFLFWPGKVALIKKAVLGFQRRILKMSLKSKSLSKHHRLDLNEPVMKALLNSSPYSHWFKSSSNMITGKYYNPTVLDSLLERARDGRCKNVQTLGRIINQELACRFIADTTIGARNSTFQKEKRFVN